MHQQNIVLDYILHETCDRQIQSISATQQALETTHGEMRDLHNTIATTLQQRDAVSEQMRLLEAKMNVNIHKMHEDLQDEVMKKLEDTIAHAHISEKMVEDRLMYRHLVDMYELNKRNSERMDAQLRTYQEDLLKREARNLEHETENANAIAQLHVEMAELEDQGKRMQQERDNLTARLEKIVKLNCEKALGVLEGVVDVTAEETEPATAEQPPVESVTEIVPNMVPDVVSDVVSDVVDETKFANFPADHCPADTKDTFEDALATMTVTNNDVNESKTVDNSPSVDRAWSSSTIRLEKSLPSTPSSIDSSESSSDSNFMSDKCPELPAHPFDREQVGHGVDLFLQNHSVRYNDEKESIKPQSSGNWRVGRSASTPVRAATKTLRDDGQRPSSLSTDDRRQTERHKGIAEWQSGASPILPTNCKLTSARPKDSPVNRSSVAAADITRANRENKQQSQEGQKLVLKEPTVDNRQKLTRKSRGKVLGTAKIRQLIDTLRNLEQQYEGRRDSISSSSDSSTHALTLSEKHQKCIELIKRTSSGRLSSETYSKSDTPGRVACLLQKLKQRHMQSGEQDARHKTVQVSRGREQQNNCEKMSDDCNEEKHRISVGLQRQLQRSYLPVLHPGQVASSNVPEWLYRYIGHPSTMNSLTTASQTGDVVEETTQTEPLDLTVQRCAVPQFAPQEHRLLRKPQETHSYPAGDLIATPTIVNVVEKGNLRQQNYKANFVSKSFQWSEQPPVAEINLNNIVQVSGKASVSSESDSTTPASTVVSSQQVTAANDLAIPSAKMSDAHGTEQVVTLLTQLLKQHQLALQQQQHLQAVQLQQLQLQQSELSKQSKLLESGKTSRLAESVERRSSLPVMVGKLRTSSRSLENKHHVKVTSNSSLVTRGLPEKQDFEKEPAKIAVVDNRVGHLRKTLILTHCRDDDASTATGKDSMRKQNGSDIEFTNSDKFLLSEADNVSCTSASDGLKKMEDKFQSLENRQTQMLKFFTNIVDKLQQKSNERSATCVPTPEASPTVTQNTTPNGTPHNSNDVRIWLPESFKRNVVEKFGREHIIDDEIVPQKPLSPTKHACEALRISTEQTASPLLPKSASPPPLSPVRSLWQPPTSTETLARQHSVSPMLIPSRSVDSHEQRKIVAPARGRQKMASLRTTKIGRHSSAIGNDHMVTIKKETKCARNIRQRSEMVPVRPSGDSKTARHSQPRSPSIQFNVSGLTSPPATWTSPHSTCPVTRMPPEPTPHSKVPLTVSRIRERVTDCPQTSSSLLGPVPRAAPVPCSPPVPPAYDTPDLELMDGKYMPMKELLDYLQDLQVINDTMQTSTQKVEQQQQPQQQKQPVRLEQRTCGGPDITEMTPISEIGSGSDVQDESEVYDYDNGGEARAKTTNRVAWYERLHSKQRKTNLYTSKNKQTQLSRKAETETGRKSSSWK